MAVLRNTTFNLPEELISRAKAYAAGQGTTLTAIIRDHLEAVTASEQKPPADDPLLLFSRGRIDRREAVRRSGLRDYAELLLALGEADLPLPTLPPHELENQAALFARIWRAA